MSDLLTDTVTAERHLAATPARVFAAYSDPTERATWGAPSDGEAYIVEAEDFREGGTEIVRCGPAENPQVTVETFYHAIRQDALIVLTEVIRHDGTLLACNLTTIELSGTPDGTQIKIIAQVTSFVGASMIRNTENGHNGSLDSLAEYLDG
ncbi:SRPBCC domain-containing protein [Pelagovum pacificum]|nr:SRPBCC domain-containing protein [Pelagovum pacificum]QQA42594.1 SRPBCC domain-containing protein [Pelagovum pacificum]